MARLWSHEQLKFETRFCSASEVELKVGFAPIPLGAVSGEVTSLSVSIPKEHLEAMLGGCSTKSNLIIDVPLEEWVEHCRMVARYFDGKGV